MPTFDQSSPYVVSYQMIRTHCFIARQVAASPEEKPDVDLIVVRENTECLVCHSTFRAL